MRILLSNDDGYRAPGIQCLFAALEKLGNTVIVAPERNRSGASNSLTLDQPLRAMKISDKVTAVNGTPTDCVHLAITGLLDYEPSIVVAGINAGANLGDDVLYSGTVAAATEGRFLGLPAVAVSLVGDELIHYETAATITTQIISKLISTPLPPDTILNINVPDVPLDRIQGIAATRLGFRHKAEPVVKAKDPRNRTIYWVGPAGEEQDAGLGTDFYAINANKVSVTPIKVDLTQHELIDQLDSWLGDI